MSLRIRNQLCVGRRIDDATAVDVEILSAPALAAVTNFVPTEILSLHSRPARVSTTQLCPSLKIIFSAVVCLIISSSSSPLSILPTPRPPRGHDDRGCPAALASRITRQLARGCQSAADVARCSASLHACAADCIMICTSTSFGSAVSSSIVLRASLCVRIHTNQLPPECFV